MKLSGWLHSLAQDLRYGLRLLRLNPGFTAIVVLSLALDTGANTAIFQLIDSLRLRTLPVAHPEQLANVRTLDRSWNSGRVHGRYADITNAQWEEIRDHQRVFSGHVDGTFLIEYSSSPLPGRFFKRRIMNNFTGNPAQMLASRKECYAQKDRSPQ